MCHEVQRKIERGDGTGDADRGIHDKTDLAGAGRGRAQGHHLACQRPGLSGGEGQRVDTSHHLAARLADRLAGFRADHLGKPLGAIGHEVGGPLQNAGAVGRREWRKVTGRIADGAIDLRGTPGGDLGDELARIRTADGDGPGTGDKATAQKEPGRT